MTPERTREIVASVAISIVVTVATVGLTEGLVRAAYALRNARVESVALPYVIDDDYGPAPPWVDAYRVLERDEVLLWRNRAGVQRRYVDVFSPVVNEADRVALIRRFRPSLPDFLQHNPTWTIALNSQGFRAPEFETPKPRSRLRVVCLGDSWTFGANVDQDQAYPQRLQALLRRAFPAADIEVLNLGVFGYSSFQGLELLRRGALALEPDAVVIGFAMNDSRVAGFRDEDVARTTGPWFMKRTAELAARSEIVRLLRYIISSARHRTTPLDEHLKAADARSADPRRASPGEQYAGAEAWTRVPLSDYERNLTEMIALAKSRGAGAILIFNELWRESPYRAAIERVSTATGVPFVDSQGLIARARREMEGEVERTRGLRPDPAPPGRAIGDAVEVVFRVTANGHHVPRAFFIVGAPAALGGLVPNRVAMHDDGTHGDQRAGDGVWSYTARLPAGAQVSYVYTNSGGQGRWEGLDVPALRTLTVDGPVGQRLYRPIESFGKLYLQADAWHTDATGYELIARAVFDALTRDEGLRTRLQEKTQR